MWIGRKAAALVVGFKILRVWSVSPKLSILGWLKSLLKVVSSQWGVGSGVKRLSFFAVCAADGGLAVFSKP